jgi:large subunit ribosomal protein L23
MNQYDIVLRPLNTEKTSNRIEIKKAIEAIFKVKVSAVNTVQIKGKKKQKGKISGKRRDWKKAIVTLMPGERIDFFEGV